MRYEFEVIGKIVGKERPRVNLNNGIVYTPGKTKDYETLIQQYFLMRYPNYIQLEGRIFVDIIAYMSIPKNTNKANREKMINEELSPTKKPDVDNIAKSVLDAMNKFVFKDDNQVSKINIEKKYSPDEEKIHIVIEEY